MVEFCDTKEIAAGIQNIIQDARAEIFLVSPYIKADRHISQRLASQANSNPEVRITVIYGKKEQPEVRDWLKDLPSVEILFSPNLHAKCYMNEEQAILTSMNLLEFSQHNNDEMGILVSRQDDPGLFEEIRKEAQRILQASEEVRVKVSRVAPAETVAPPPPVATRDTPRAPQRKPEPAVGIPNTAFCIRDKAVIPPNPGKPYCDRCFGSWNRYKNYEYAEKYCHICGNENDSTMAKPLCLSCYRTYKDVFEFAL